MSGIKRNGCFDCLRADGSKVAGVSCGACTGNGLRGEITDRRVVSDTPDALVKELRFAAGGGYGDTSGAIAALLRTAADTIATPAAQGDAA